MPVLCPESKPPILHLTSQCALVLGKSCIQSGPPSSVLKTSVESNRHLEVRPGLGSSVWYCLSGAQACTAHPWLMPAPWHCWDSTENKSLFALCKWILCKITFLFFKIKQFHMIHGYILIIYLANGRNIKPRLKKKNYPFQRCGWARCGLNSSGFVSYPQAHSFCRKLALAFLSLCTYMTI